MIETLRVIRCDASVRLPARAPRPGINRSVMPAKSVPCTRFYPIRTEPEAAWASAQRKGWVAGPAVEALPLTHLCPLHAPASRS